MTRLYCGPYADLVGRSEHGGRVARVMPDGSLTENISEGGFDGHVGFRATCTCGWIGAGTYAPDYSSFGYYPGAQEAEEEWDRDHLLPLIEEAEAAWPAWAARVADAARHLANYAAGETRAGLPLEGVALMERLLQERERITASLYWPGKPEPNDEEY